jgi:hypothetical protein
MQDRVCGFPKMRLPDLGRLCVMVPKCTESWAASAQDWTTVRRKYTLNEQEPNWMILAKLEEPLGRLSYQLDQRDLLIAAQPAH